MCYSSYLFDRDFTLQRVCALFLNAFWCALWTIMLTVLKLPVQQSQNQRRICPLMCTAVGKVNSCHAKLQAAQAVAQIRMSRHRTNLFSSLAGGSIFCFCE